MNMEITQRDYGDVKVYITPLDNSEPSRRRRSESAAVAALVRYAFGADHTVGHEDSGAPIVRYRQITYNNISISHSRTHAALAVAPSGCYVGIDIEHNRSRQLHNIARRIFTPGEMKEYGGTETGLLTAWTLKEAIFKSYRGGELSLRNDIRLPMPASAPTALIKAAPVEVLAVDTIESMAIAVVLNRFRNSVGRPE